MNFQPTDIDYLLSPRAIRERTRAVYELALKGGTHFAIHPEKLDATAEYVLAVIREKYPTLDIPFHSRNGHFVAGGKSLLPIINDKIQALSPMERTRTKLDLTVVSVLLDAGAGEKWHYQDPATKTTVARSEGLAVASLHMFMSGAFSSAKGDPLRADAQGLKNLKPADIEKHFQVTTENPLIGVEGRVHLLNKLGDVLFAHPQVFKNQRVGDMLDYLREKHGEKLQAKHVLDFVLRYFGAIWPSRLTLGTQSLGDVWTHPKLGSELKGLVPFHKLSQWLTYSLLVPIIEMGIEVSGVDELTGLAEYRNGGLMLDSGLISLRNPDDLTRGHKPESELIIEWRALTVVLLDEIANRIRESLKMTKEELPLAKVLEGGTWHAGRKIAKEKRSGGEPPLNIISDGTVF